MWLTAGKAIPDAVRVAVCPPRRVIHRFLPQLMWLCHHSMEPCEGQSEGPEGNTADLIPDLGKSS